MERKNSEPMDRRIRKKPEPKYTIFLLLKISLIILLIGTMFYTVQAGNRGVLMTFGKVDLNSKGEGLHMKIPLVQTVKKMEVKTQKYEADASSASKDLQIVSTKIAVNYHLLPERVPEIYQELGLGYNDRLTQPAVQEVVKAITATYTAEELITKRPQVKEDIKFALQERLNPRGIIVEDISLTEFDFSDSFNDAIEAKVTAEQEKLKAEMDLQRIKVESDQIIASAIGKAEAISIESKALRENPDILQMRAIEKWDGVLSLVASENVMPFIDLGMGTIPRSPNG